MSTGASNDDRSFPKESSRDDRHASDATSPEHNPTAPQEDDDLPEDPSRPLTIDDVPRLGSGGSIAVGCGLLVVAAVIAFWAIRGWFLHG